MELKEFIREALTNIVEGVESANKEFARFQLATGHHYGKNIEGTEVEFDVSVVAQDKVETEGKGRFGILIANAFVGGSGEARKEKSNQDTNRIKFKVFITEK